MSQHEAILARLGEQFAKGRDAGDLFFFPSTVHTHEEAGVEFEIRLCPALQHKPRLPSPHFEADADIIRAGGNSELVNEKSSGKPDPFAPPYIRNLLVGELKDEDGEEYVVLLNKFSVVEEHFLLITKEFQSQASPLYPNELTQAYLLLQAAQRAGRNFFAFYNCGNDSGASQPHKHIQFLPIENDGPPIEKLARTVNLESNTKAFSLNSLPYAVHVRRLPPLYASTPRSELEDKLGEAFMTLLDLAISSVRHSPEHPVGLPSYNVILTRTHLYVVPRKCEMHRLQETGDKLSVNSLGFAGYLLVKSERELEAVQKEGVVTILNDVGVANVHEEQIMDAHERDPA